MIEPPMEIRGHPKLMHAFENLVELYLDAMTKHVLEHSVVSVEDNHAMLCTEMRITYLDPPHHKRPQALISVTKY